MVAPSIVQSGYGLAIGLMGLMFFEQVMYYLEAWYLEVPTNTCVTSNTIFDYTFLTVRARVDLIVVAAQKNVFFHNSPKVVVGHGLKDYGVKNLFTM